MKSRARGGAVELKWGSRGVRAPQETPTGGPAPDPTLETPAHPTSGQESTAVTEQQLRRSRPHVVLV